MLPFPLGEPLLWPMSHQWGNKRERDSCLVNCCWRGHLTCCLHGGRGELFNPPQGAHMGLPIAFSYPFLDGLFGLSHVKHTTISPSNILLPLIIKLTQQSELKSSFKLSALSLVRFIFLLNSPIWNYRWLYKTQCTQRQTMPFFERHRQPMDNIN